MHPIPYRLRYSHQSDGMMRKMLGGNRLPTRTQSGKQSVKALLAWRRQCAAQHTNKEHKSLFYKVTSVAFLAMSGRACRVTRPRNI